MPRKLYYILCAKALVAVVLMVWGGIALAPDEAQYWSWSRELDFGYYSKPPGIAWQIFLTTGILGSSELGVRAGAVVVAFLVAWALYGLAKGSGLNERQSFWAAVAFALCPLGWYLSVAATTDGGAVLGIVMALRAFVKRPTDLWKVGLWIGFGALFKWVAFLAWPCIFLFAKPSRRMLWGVGISLLALLPSLYWNFSHDFATFKHVAATVAPKAKKGNFLDFAGSQLALLGPIFFILLIASYKKIREVPRGVLVCATFTLFALGYFGAAFFQKMQPNWALYLYPPGLILLAWYAVERFPRWLVGGVTLSCLLFLGALAIPYVQRHNLVALPYKANPFRQNLGWEQLTTIFQGLDFDPATDFIFSDKYQTVSILNFYAHNSYFFNLQKMRKNQYSYEASVSGEKGKTGYFVVAENAAEEDLPWYKDHYTEKLVPYFASLEYVGSYPLFTAQGKGVKHALVFRGLNYNGLVPQDIEKY